MRILLTISLLFFVISRPLFSHPFQANAYIVVDTDGGIDDYRTLCLLLSAPDVRVLGITASAGVLQAEQVAIKVQALLNSLNHEGIPVAINPLLPGQGMDCGPAMEFSWGATSGIDPQQFISIDSLAGYLSAHFRKGIHFINLGSLSTLFHLNASKPEFTGNIQTILWSSNTTAPFSGFNHRIDTNLAARIHELPVKPVIVQGEGQYDEAFVHETGKIWSLSAEKFMRAFGDIPAQSPMSMRAYDEMTAVYLHFRDQFHTDTLEHVIFANYQGNDKLQAHIKTILGEFHLQFHQIMKTLPQDTVFYQPDVQPTMEQIIHQHGLAEWNAAVQTFELHRHIGIYALVGTKMGIRAMEYFGAGIDELSVVSHTGLRPPVSCMNDGIQVSTGATLGHGLIRVLKEKMEPAAEFTYMGQSIRISLKPQYRDIIAAEFGELVKTYGLQSDAYWDQVRANALRYWLEMSRFEIFDVERL